jgi:hypothetical protein
MQIDTKYIHTFASVGHFLKFQRRVTYGSWPTYMVLRLHEYERTITILKQQVFYEHFGGVGQLECLGIFVNTQTKNCV